MLVDYEYFFFQPWNRQVIHENETKILKFNIVRVDRKMNIGKNYNLVSDVTSMSSS